MWHLDETTWSISILWWELFPRQKHISILKDGTNTWIDKTKSFWVRTLLRCWYGLLPWQLFSPNIFLKILSSFLNPLRKIYWKIFVWASNPKASSIEEIINSSTLLSRQNVKQIQFILYFGNCLWFFYIVLLLLKC